MNSVLDKVVAGDDFASDIGTVVLVGFIAHDNTYRPTGAEQSCASWNAGIPKAKMHARLKHREPLFVGWKEDFFFTLNRNAPKGDSVIWVVVITNDVVWHNYSYHK